MEIGQKIYRICSIDHNVYTLEISEIKDIWYMKQVNNSSFCILGLCPIIGDFRLMVVEYIWDLNKLIQVGQNYITLNEKLAIQKYKELCSKKDS